MDAFKELCGPDAYPGVTLLTTFWDVVQQQSEDVRGAALRRQAELDASPHFGQDILTRGGRSAALRPGRAHALALLDDIVRRHHRLALRIQVEIVAAGRALRDGHRRIWRGPRRLRPRGGRNSMTPLAKVLWHSAFI
jgi:hypothetical protein